MMGFLDHDHFERGVLCGEVEGKRGRKDEGRGRKKVVCMRWMEAREGGYKRRGNLLGGTWGRLLKESSKIKIKIK
jgi:hypothetical protein